MEREAAAKPGYRYSLDPFLLVDFAAADKGRRWVDLGTGAGVMPVLLAAEERLRRIVGIEVQATLAHKAQRLVTEAGATQQVEILHGDLRDCRSRLPAASCDVVLANPPYRRSGSGRLAPDGERAAARHELHGGLADFVEAARYLLKPGGRCFLVYLPERLAELLTLLTAARLEPKRLRLVHGRADTAASMLLVEARRNGRPGLLVERPLLVYDGPDYSSETAALLERWRRHLPAGADCQVLAS